MSAEVNGNVSLRNILESDVILTVIQFIGIKDATRSFCRVNKLCQRKYREAYTTTKLNAKPIAKLVESEGRKICEILDALRWAVLDLQLAKLSPAAARVVHNMNDLQSLRGMGLHEDLGRLNMYVYSYWHKGAASAGVFQWLKDAVKINPHLTWKASVEQDVQYWKDSRVFGDFFILFDREDGTVLVSTDFLKVFYLYC